MGSENNPSPSIPSCKLFNQRSEGLAQVLPSHSCAKNTRGIMAVKSNPDYIFHFMDWVEGAHPAMEARTYAEGLTAESLPRRLIPQLADFVYNFTTCPLPASESQNSRLYILTAVAKLISQTDASDNNKDKLPTFAT